MNLTSSDSAYCDLNPIIISNVNFTAVQAGQNGTAMNYTINQCFANLSQNYGNLSDTNASLNAMTFQSIDKYIIVANGTKPTDLKNWSANLSAFDERYAFGSFDIYFQNNSADLIDYLNMNTSLTYDDTPEIIHNVSITDGQLLINWTTPSAMLKPSRINTGIGFIHLHLNKSAGTKSLAVYGKIYLRNSANGETLLAQTEQSGVIPTATTEQDMHFAINETALNATDRITVQIYAVVGTVGSAPDLQTFVRNLTLSRLELPSSTSTISETEPSWNGNYSAFLQIISNASISNSTFNTSLNNAWGNITQLETNLSNANSTIASLQTNISSMNNATIVHKNGNAIENATLNWANVTGNPFYNDSQNISMTTPRNLTINGWILINSTIAKDATCQASLWGKFGATSGGGTTNDILWWCAQNSSGNYNWVQVAIGGVG